jgi:hypothetical protein
MSCCSINRTLEEQHGASAAEKASPMANKIDVKNFNHPGLIKSVDAADRSGPLRIRKA